MRMICLSLLTLIVPSAATAQERRASQNPDVVLQDIPPAPIQSGQTAKIGASRVGERQSATQTAQGAHIKPMARLSGRIQNRVQSRIRNRIDRYYDPQANATSPFVVAGQEAQRQRR